MQKSRVSAHLKEKEKKEKEPKRNKRKRIYIRVINILINVVI